MPRLRTSEMQITGLAGQEKRSWSGWGRPWPLLSSQWKFRSQSVSIRVKTNAQDQFLRSIIAPPCDSVKETKQMRQYILKLNLQKTHKFMSAYFKGRCPLESVCQTRKHGHRSSAFLGQCQIRYLPTHVFAKVQTSRTGIHLPREMPQVVCSWQAQLYLLFQMRFVFLLSVTR